jgi:hypothetical protein
MKVFSPWLLLAYVGYCFYRVPTINDSIIVLSIAALCVFELFYKSKLVIYEKSMEKKASKTDELHEELVIVQLENKIRDEKSKVLNRGLGEVSGDRAITF